jgi:glycosyltransferase involved in cell wall biosynthesis
MIYPNNPISVTILTNNSEQHLSSVLKALQGFDEIVVVDTGSSDATIHIAQQFPNVSIHSLPFQGFGPTHNAASALAKHDWVLSIDSDEIVSPPLADEILIKTTLDPNHVYSIPRHNLYRGRHIKGCGWYPDRVIRLYNRQKTSFSSDLVHEKILTDNLHVKKFAHPLIHQPFSSISAFIKKMDAYSDLYAKQHPDKQISLTKAISHAAYAFIRSYIFKRGFLLGAEGFEISWYNMNCAFYKYAKARALTLSSNDTNTPS